MATGDCGRRRKRNGGIGAMESGRKRAMKATRTGSSRRKTVSRRLRRQSSSSNIRLQNHRCLLKSPGNLTSPESSDSSGLVTGLSCSSSCSSDGFTAYRSSSGDSNEFVDHRLRSVDLEADGFETEHSKFTDDKLSGEMTTSCELCGDSEELESTTKPSKQTARLRSPAMKMPTEAELEEFFSEAEKYEAKRFAEKYNYDIVKDVPLEGRYHWVQLQP
ncbi:cyclin-dependent kinase inhibitor 7-like [Malania oleifera]|uniref:cyclin-dependent kinase inhibitor 7-like n=1 Tax=Malania oleifera TaxID=397392 RepID=UPI0025AE720E|nr:cyclin-dependent kinase inhibitor 7-like [Malania oleifera]